MLQICLILTNILPTITPSIDPNSIHDIILPFPQVQPAISPAILPQPSDLIFLPLSLINGTIIRYVAAFTMLFDNVLAVIRTVAVGEHGGSVGFVPGDAAAALVAGLRVLEAASLAES